MLRDSLRTLKKNTMTQSQQNRREARLNKVSAKIQEASLKYGSSSNKVIALRLQFSNILNS